MRRAMSGCGESDHLLAPMERYVDAAERRHFFVLILVLVSLVFKCWDQVFLPQSRLLLSLHHLPT